MKIHTRTNRKVNPSKKQRGKSVKFLDLRGNNEANDICDKIVHLRSLRGQIDAALKILMPQLDQKLGDANSALTDRHMIKLVETHHNERVVQAYDASFWQIKEVKNLDNIFDVIAKSIPSALKIVSSNSEGTK